MKRDITHKKLSSKLFPTLLLLVYYWLYTSITFGYFLSKIFYNVFDTLHKNSLSKRIQLRKKFHFKNLIKTIIDFCWKLLKDWFLRIFQKYSSLMRVLDRPVIAIQIFLKNFLKSPFRFKHNFLLFKVLLDIFADIFIIVCSLINEILLFNNLINWLIKWRNLIQFLMKESLFINTIVYALYFILLGLFGILVGFLLGLYRHKYENETDEIEHIYLFFLLLLLHILSHKEFDDIFYLTDSSLAANIEEFSFKPLPQIESRPFKFILKETEQTPQIPFPILDDPSVNIQIDFVWDESIHYKFQLFELYQNLNEKVKH